MEYDPAVRQTRIKGGPIKTVKRPHTCNKTRMKSGPQGDNKQKLKNTRKNVNKTVLKGKTTNDKTLTKQTQTLTKHDPNTTNMLKQKTQDNKSKFSKHMFLYYRVVLRFL